MMNNTECNCIEIIDDLKRGDCATACGKIQNNNCCKCCDERGNGMLHVLAKIKMEPMDECAQVLAQILDKPNLYEFLNNQNCDGETAFLVAVKNGNEVGANMFDNKGANGAIADYTGNYVNEDSDKSCEETNNNPPFNETTLNFNDATKYVTETPSKILEDTDVFFSNLYNTIGKTANTVTTTVTKTVPSIFISETTSDAIPTPMKTQTNVTPLTKTTPFILDTDTMLAKVKEASTLKSLPTMSAQSVYSTPNKVISSTPTTAPTMSAQSVYSTPNKVVSSTPIVTGGYDDDYDATYGGKHKSVTTRKLKLHSDRVRGGNDSYGFKSWGDFLKGGEYTDDEDEEEEGRSELSRLINNRKNEIHSEVETRLLEMLSNGLITYKSKPIEATEKNARLIKSFLYNYVRDKNPTLSGMDKITTVKNMPDSEIIELTEDVDLEAIEKRNEGFRQKHLEAKEEKHKERAKVQEDSDTTLSVDDLVTEKPKKKKEEKAKKSDKEEKKKKSKK